MSDFAAIVGGIDVTGAEGRFRVASIGDAPSYLAARSPSGGPALLVRCSSPKPLMPVRLAGIEARYGVRCRFRDEHGEIEERLSIVECLIDGVEEQRFFCGCVDQLIALLGQSPSTEALGQAVGRLVAMFRALSQPARKDVVGLLGELCTVYAASNVSEAVRAWRLDPRERFDFVAGTLRLDVKATCGPDRVHHLSAQQATPAQGTLGVIASVLVSMATGGTSLDEFITLISERLGSDREGIFRVHEVVSLTMGTATSQALQTRFDLHGTLQSLLFFETSTVPALRPPFPDGISDVRFRVDLDLVDPTRIAQLKRQLDSEGRAVLPARETPIRVRGA